MIQFYFQRKVSFSFKLALVLLFASFGVSALAQKTASVSGNWSNPSTWSPSGVPTLTDAVIINPGITVTVDISNAQAASLQLNVVGMGLQTSSIVFNASSQLTVTGMFTMAQDIERPGIINMNSGGTLSVAGFSASFPSGSSFIPGSGTITLTGNNSLPNSLFANLNNLTIASGTTTITGNTLLSGDLTVQSGILDLTSYTIARSGATGGTVTLAAGSTLKVGATSGFPNNFSTYTLSASSTTEFYGTTQLIRGTTYGNLVLNGGAKSANGSITVMGNLTSNADLNALTFTHNLYKDWINTGNFNAGTSTIEFFGITQQQMPGVMFNNLRNTNVTDAVVANGNITVNGTYTSTSIFCVLDMKTYNFSMPLSGVISNAGTVKTQSISSTPLPQDKTWGIPTTGTVLYNASSGGQTLVKGTYNNLKVEHTAGGTSTANGDIVIGGNIEASTTTSIINMGIYQLTHQVVGGIGAQTNVGTIRTQNTSSLPLPTGRVWGGTVLYDAAAGGQKIVFGTYNNLSVTTNGAENVASSIVVNGNLITSATTTMNMNQESITGTFNASGNAGTIRTQAQTGAFTSGKTWGGTVVYDATSTSNGAQTIIDGNYNNLTISLDRGSNNNITLPSSLNVAGNLLFNATLNGSGQFITTGNTFNFNGTNQSISVSANSATGTFKFNNVTISGGGSKTLATAVTIDGNLTLTNGTLVATVANMLMLTSNATVTAPALGTNTSYVQGPLRKVGTTAFTFPLGISGTYAPLSIAAPGTGGDFTAEYLRPQNLGSNKTAPILRVSPCEYWNVTKNGGANDPAVTLSWSSASNCSSGQYVTDVPTLVIAKWNGSSWITAGNSASTGTASQGTVTSNSSTLAAPYGAITLASTSATQNPLPVKFTSIRAIAIADGVKVEWNVATEADVAYYEIERSNNATEFNTIGKTSATVNNGSAANYTYIDRTTLSSTLFYRIRVVDKDGKIAYSTVAKVNPGTSIVSLETYPNPVKDRILTISATGLNKGDIAVTIYDIAGRTVYTQKIGVQNSSLVQTINLPSGLQKGIYSIKINDADNVTVSKRFIIE